MLDTLKLVSPVIDCLQGSKIEGSCMRRTGVVMASGELQYELITGSLAGSFDHRISVRVDDAYNTHPGKLGRGKVLTIEGSVHKAMIGHNVYGGPLDLAPAAAWFVDRVGQLVDCELPPASLWQVARLDWAECFELPSGDACLAYIGGLKAADYPRREVTVYKTSLSVPGTTTSFKTYMKGPEFLKHDKARLKKQFDLGLLTELEEKAGRILRFETSFHAKKLAGKAIDGKVRIADIDRAWLESSHDLEARRLLREADTAMETVCKHNAVAARLASLHDAPTAGRLYGFWLVLAADGEKIGKRRVPLRTFYHYRKMLEAAGVSWYGTNIHVLDASLVPVGFSPTRNSPFRLTGEHPGVASAMAPYRSAAAA